MKKRIITLLLALVLCVSLLPLGAEAEATNLREYTIDIGTRSQIGDIGENCDLGLTLYGEDGRSTGEVRLGLPGGNSLTWYNDTVIPMTAVDVGVVKNVDIHYYSKGDKWTMNHMYIDGAPVRLGNADGMYPWKQFTDGDVFSRDVGNAGDFPIMPFNTIPQADYDLRFTAGSGEADGMDWNSSFHLPFAIHGTDGVVTQSGLYSSVNVYTARIGSGEVSGGVFRLNRVEAIEYIDIRLDCQNNDYLRCASLTINGVSYYAGEDVFYPGDTLRFYPYKPSGGLANFSRSIQYTNGQFTDVDESQWYGANQQRVVRDAVRLGLMKGNSAATFNPTGNVSLAEAITMACRIHSIYHRGTAGFTQGSDWFQVYLDYALANGIIPTGFVSSSAAAKSTPATRAQFACVLSGALPDAALPAINNVTELPDVTAYTRYAREIFKLYNAGVTTGNDEYGTFTPDSYIQRAAAAAIASRMACATMRKTFTLAIPNYEGLLAEAWSYYSSQNYAKAFPMLLRLSSVGSPNVQTLLGDCYYGGYGVTQSYGKAMEYYLLASEQDYSAAICSVGYLHDRGYGVAENNAKAAGWYQRAVDLGDARAQFNLGRFYQTGEGVTQNINKAKELYQLSAAQGYQAAIDILASDF